VRALLPVSPRWFQHPRVRPGPQWREPALAHGHGQSPVTSKEEVERAARRRDPGPGRKLFGVSLRCARTMPGLALVFVDEVDLGAARKQGVPLSCQPSHRASRSPEVRWRCCLGDAERLVFECGTPLRPDCVGADLSMICSEYGAATKMLALQIRRLERALRSFFAFGRERGRLESTGIGLGGSKRPCRAGSVIGAAGHRHCDVSLRARLPLSERIEDVFFQRGGSRPAEARSPARWSSAGSLNAQAVHQERALA